MYVQVFSLFCALATNLASAQYDYVEVLEKSLYFYETERAGRLPADNRVPWRGDSALTDGQDKGLDLTGGYYDAGDHVKFNFPLAQSLAVLAWGFWSFPEAYTSNGLTYRMADTLRWGYNFLIKSHVEDHVFIGQIGNSTLDHSFWNRPENMTMERLTYEISEDKPGSDLAGEAAAAFAAGSLAFRGIDDSYAATLLDHARRLYEFGYNFRGLYSDHMPNDNYASSGYEDEMCWGAVWLYHATLEQQYLNYALEFYSSDVPWNFFWNDKSPGAWVLLYKATQDSEFRNSVANYLNPWFPGGSIPYTPLGLAWRHEWGPLRHSANAAAIALLAAQEGIILGDPDFGDSREWARNQIHYMLGDTGRSFVQGFGVNPPLSTHHRSASCNPDFSVPCSWDDHRSPDPNPSIAIGALVGGPNLTDFYEDSRSNYRQNEVGLDYNAGFQTCIAALIQLDSQN